MISDKLFSDIISNYRTATSSASLQPDIIYDDDIVPGASVEVEIRFGKYSVDKDGNNTFSAGVKYHEYIRLINEFINENSESGDVINEFTNEDSKKSDVIIDDFYELTSQPNALDRSSVTKKIFRKSTIDDTVEWIIKHRSEDLLSSDEIANLQVPEYNYRVGITIEQNIDERKISNKGVHTFYDNDKLEFLYRREKIRYFLEFGDTGNQLHITKVISSSPRKDEVSVTYEVELELSKDFSVLDVESLNLDLEYVFEILYGTNFVYTESERINLVKYVNELHHKKYDEEDIAKNIIVEARNLKYKDLKIGGIYGGDIGYRVTDKADGQRYLLIVHDNGIWLVSTKFQYNLVMRIDWLDEYKEYKDNIYGLILDGEEIPSINRKEGAEESKYWYHVFDVLATKSDTTIQNKPHSDRLELARTSISMLNIMLKRDIMIIKMKDFLGINSVNSFFKTNRDMLMKNTLYYTDGLIFTPNNYKYNVSKDTAKISLSDRILTEYPDICKWKPEITTDLSIGEDGNLKTVKFVGKKVKYVDFTGNNNVTFDPTNYEKIIQQTDEDISEVPVGTVIEFKWNGNSLEPIRIRYDKVKPNPIHIAKDNWNSIHNDIDEKTILGESTKLLRKYHNVIKRRLFDILPENATLLDMASGRGGDISKWKKFSKIVAVEPDINHIEDSEKEGKVIRGLRYRVDKAGMSDKVKIVQAKAQDTKLISKEVKSFLGDKADYCSIMLGFSFLWDSEKTFNSLIDTIIDNTKKSLLYLTIDGDVIKQLWNPCFSSIKAPNPLIIGNAQDRNNKLDFIQYDPNEKKGPILVNIGDIVNMQYEYLVQLEDMMRFFDTRCIYRADQEVFLNEGEKILSSMYTYGIFDIKSPQIEFKKANTKKQMISSYPIIPEGSSKPVIPMEKSKMEEDDISPQIPSPSPSPQIPSPSPSPQQDREILNTEGESLSMLTSIQGRNEKEIKQDLNVRWYNDEKVIRISTLGDGSCFLHAYLKGFYDKYQESTSLSFRINIVKDTRRDLALKLSDTNPEYNIIARDDYYGELRDSGYSREDAASIADKAMIDNKLDTFTYWETVGNGLNIYMLTRHILDPSLMSEGDDRADILNMQKDMNSNIYLSIFHIIAITDMVGVDVIIFQGFKDNISFHMTTHLEGRDRPIVCILHINNPQHYELIGVERQNGIQTVFGISDPFIEKLFSMIELKKYIKHHPEDVMYEAIVRNYEDYGKIDDNGNIVIPDILSVTNLNKDDPYVMMLYDMFKVNENNEIVISKNAINNIKKHLLEQGFNIRSPE